MSLEESWAAESARFAEVPAARPSPKAAGWTGVEALVEFHGEPVASWSCAGEEPEEAKDDGAEVTVRNAEMRRVELALREGQKASDQVLTRFLMEQRAREKEEKEKAAAQGSEEK